MAKKRHTSPQEAPQTVTDIEQMMSEAATVKVGRANVADRKTVRSDNYATLYANDIQIQTTPWDIRLIFGLIEVLPTLDSPSATINQVGELHVSPQLAKRVAMLLMQQLSVYEKQMGEIPQPQD